MLTPDEDSLVFGGNFVHRHSLEMQLRIHRLECAMRVGADFRFPNYQKLMWYAARDFVGECAELLRQERRQVVEEEEETSLHYNNDNESAEHVCPGGRRRREKTTTEEERAGRQLRYQRARILCAAYPPRILRGYGALARELARWSTSNAKSAIEQYPVNMDIVAVANELGGMMRPCATLLDEKKKRRGGKPIMADRRSTGLSTT